MSREELAAEYGPYVDPPDDEDFCPCCFAMLKLQPAGWRDEP